MVEGVTIATRLWYIARYVEMSEDSPAAQLHKTYVVILEDIIITQELTHVSLDGI